MVFRGFDTVGLLARDLDVLSEVAKHIYVAPEPTKAYGHCSIAIAHTNIAASNQNSLPQRILAH